MRHAATAIAAAGIAALGLALAGGAAAQESQEALFAGLSENGKKIVTEANTTLTADANKACEAGRARVTEEVKAAARRLQESGQLAGGPGFFQIEAENYYNRFCGRRMRR